MLTNFFFSISPDKFGDYPIWLTLYIAQVILPMVALAAVAIKILVKSGKDMRREMWGVRCGIFGFCLLSFPHNTRKIYKLRQLTVKSRAVARLG